jgi:hypothetical protein
MSSLLDQVLDANGGHERWRTTRKVRGRITYGGSFWALKGHPDLVGTDVVEADPHRQHIRLCQESTGRIIDFDKDSDLLTVTGPDGRLIEELHAPRSTFDGLTTKSRWGLGQAAYFRGYATWVSLIEPFLFTWPGVESEEVGPWVQNGHAWRGLSVTFPDDIDTHDGTQRYFYNEARHLRRSEYQLAVHGHATATHQVDRFGIFDGFVVPTLRRIRVQLEDRDADSSWSPVTLETADVRFS